MNKHLLVFKQKKIPDNERIASHSLHRMKSLIVFYTKSRRKTASWVTQKITNNSNVHAIT